MNDLIQRIVNAIIKQEGMSPEHTNPGNLRDCPWFPRCVNAKGEPVRMYPVIDGYVAYVHYAGGFWMPRSRAEGIAGAAHVVALHIAEGNSLAELISIWAPPSENNTAGYVANVKQWANIPNENLALWNYIQEAVS